MPIQYHFDPVLKILLAKGSEIISLDDVLQYGRNVLEQPHDLKETIEYIDLSEAKDVAVSYQSAQQMLSIYQQWMERGVIGSVVYAPNDVCYGMARMISVVLSSVAGGPVRGHILSRTPIRPENLRSWLAKAIMAEQNASK